MSSFVLSSAALACAPLLVAAVVTDPAPDPSMVILRGGDATNIDGSPFSFDAGANGGGIFVFDNNTGTPISAIDITASVPDPNPQTPPTYSIFNYVLPGTSVTPVFGQDCAGNPGNFDCVHIVLSDPLGTAPILPGTNFAIDLNNSPFNDPGVNPPNYTGTDQPNGAGNWGPSTTFSSTLQDSSPEPATLPLAASGLAALFLLARRRLFLQRQ